MEQSNRPDMSVTYVNLNTADLLRDSLISIYDQSWEHSIEVVIVDNASTDHSVEMIREEFPQATLIVNPEYRGFGAGNNQAFYSSKGRYLLMLNTDTIVLPGSLDAMIDFMDEHEDAGAMGCKLLNADGSLQRSCWRGFPSLTSAIVDAFYLWRVAPFLRWVKDTELSEEELEGMLEVDHLLGACMLIRSEVIEEVGALNEEYVIYLEETDLCYRMKKAGWKIFFDPTGEVIHFGQQTGRRMPVRSLLQSYRNYYRFCKDNRLCSPWELRLLKLTIMAASLIRIPLWTVRLTTRDREMCRGMIRGYWSVLKAAPSY